METALLLGGGLMSAYGQYQGQQYAAAQSERAAEVGRIQANQTDSAYRQELTSTIANIRALRAGAGVGARSPTGMAIEAAQARKSDRDRRIDVGNKRMQATQDQNDARFRRSSAGWALLGGAAGAVGQNYGGLTKYFGS